MAPGQTTREQSFHAGHSGPSSVLRADFMELYQTRLRQFCIIGLIAVPLLYSLELGYALVSGSDVALGQYAMARGLLLLTFGGSYLFLRKTPSASFAALRFIDWLIIGSTMVVSNHIGFDMNGVDGPFFAGIIQLNFLRAFFVPGGLRLAAPIMIFGAVSFPLQLLLSTNFMPGLAEQLRDPEHLAWVLVEVELIVGTSIIAGIGAYMIDRLQRQSLRLRQIGRYNIERRLGEGGMGVVYLARHGILKRPVAIKLLSPERPIDDASRARFEQEALHTAQLHHPNTIQILDFGATDDGMLYYAMEYIEGLDLAHLVLLHGVQPAGRVIHFATQAARSLGHAHARGIVHRDVKPANCIADGPAGQPDFLKVLDFGLAKMVDLGSVDGHSDTIETSAANTIKGTPAYMSPEQCLGNPVDARSDIYSLGCVLYYLLTGRPIFDDDTWVKVVVNHTNQPPEAPSAHNAEIPKDLEAVVLRCLAKLPRDRYQSAEDLERALLACGDAGAWTVSDAATWWSTRAASIDLQADGSLDVETLSVNTTAHLPSELPRTNPLVRPTVSTDSHRRAQDSDQG